MRAAYQVRGAGAVGQAGNFSKANVTLINYERPGRGDSYQKGGVDINFNDKQFPALLPGKVIEVGNQPGGYGLWVTTEHIDPKTGKPFQLINAHFDAIYVKEGQSLQPGTVLGKQGSTGTTSSGGIASIDPIMPAPRCSRAQIPYIRPGVLKEALNSLIR
jgi:murein DD-endopeptidase MepM/ murein hydrolase activator NlpD